MITINQLLKLSNNENWQKQVQNLQTEEQKEIIKLDFTKLKKELRNFQKKGVKFILQKQKAFLADDMGLGKTVQCIAAMELSQSYPALIITPASMKYKWQEEIESWIKAERNISIIESGKNNSFSTDIIIINYDLLEKYKKELLAISFKMCIMDESHYLKNPKAKRTKALSQIIKDIPYRIAVTGTPILSRPAELISQLKILERFDALFGHWENYVTRYCNAKKTQFGWDIKGASNLEELNLILKSSCLLRRTKKEVLKELPDKIKSVIPIRITNLQEYKQAEERIITWLEQNQRATEPEILGKLVILRKLAGLGKVKPAKEWIANFLETNQKLVVFAYHHDIINELANEFSAPTITGRTSAKERENIVKKFQETELQIIICNIRAAGVGLTLTKANTMLFVELDWTPAQHEQAEDRIYRIGQNQTVNIYYMIAKDTIDTSIIKMLRKKKNIFTNLIELKNIINYSKCSR